MSERSLYREALLVLRAIADGEGQAEVLRQVVERAAAFTGASACLLLQVQADGLARVVQSVGLDPARVTGLAIPPSERVVIQLGAELDIPADVTFVGAPVVGKDGLLGVLAVYLPSPRQEPGAFEAELLSAFADLASVAMEHGARTRAQREGEERLRASEALFRAYFNTPAIGIAVTTPQQAWLEVNDRFCAMLGYTRGELEHRTWADVTHPEDVAASQREHERVMNGGAEGYSLDSRLVRKDGSVIWALLSVSVARLPDGEPAYFVALAKDITARKLAEAALGESRLRLALVLEGSELGAWDWKVGESDVTVDRRWREIVGLGGGGDESRVTREVWKARIHPEDAARTIDAAAALVRGDASNYDLEYRIRAPDDGWRWVRSRAKAVVRDGRGTALRIAGTLADVSERKRSEIERERLVTAIEQAAETVMVADAAGRIEYVNPSFERVTGYSRAEVLGRSPRLLKSWVQDEATYRALWETILGGRTWQGRLVNKRKDGTLFTEEATISPVLDQAGQISSFVAVKRDITDTLALEASLLQSQKLESIGRLAGGVAHDFNNLLTVILICGAELDRELREGHPPSAEDAAQILEAGRRAAELTRQLLAFARKQVVTPVVLDVNEAVRRSDKLLRRVIGENVAIVERLQDGVWPVRIDPGLLDQVLLNLVVNARDAMPGGGTLTLATENVLIAPGEVAATPDAAPGPHVRLTVQDTGLGMSPEVLSRAFEPFFTTKPTGQGTGLGLATVYGIVKQSGADIGVRSAPGQGTTFEILFPRADPVQARPSPPAAARGRGTESILVVEDEASVREVVVRALRSAGYRVLVAEGGRQAIELLTRGQGAPALMVTDLVMPGLSGRELAERVAGLYPGVRVLYMSGYTHDALGHGGAADEGIRLLAKLFTASALLSRAREELDRC